MNIPQNPTTKAETALREAWSQRGWRRSTLLFSAAALLAFLANLAFTIWATSTHEITNGTGVIAEKECSDITKLNSGLHILINALSTVLLAGSNYCMQCLSSPTRSQIDNAHKSRSWMDIGVSSFRNFFSGELSGKRTVLWVLLAASSLPLHLFYNSAVFQSISVNAYNVWLMNEDWINTGSKASINPFTTVNKYELIDPLHNAISQGLLERLDATACIEAYAVPFQSVRSDLVLIADGDGPDFGLMKNTDNARLQLDPMDTCGTTQAFQWMCTQYQPVIPHPWDGYTCETLCEQLIDTLRNDTRADNWHPFESKPVKYCYSLPSKEHCRLQFSAGLLITVLVLNMFKLVLMLSCAFGWPDEPPLLTVGDAVVSFLQRPDESTEDMCLLTRDAVELAWSKYSEQPSYVFEDQRRRRYEAASRVKWILSLVLTAAAVMICLLLLFYGIGKIKGTKDISTLFGLGLGAVNSKTLIITDVAGHGTTSLISNVMLANTPQLVFSLVYFSYNGICTTMSLAEEWSGFADPAHGRKGLRRSGRTVGAQRSAYFLQLPYRIAIPLIAMSGGLHWLISQSFFLVYVETFVANTETYLMTVNQPDAGVRGSLITCGWSPVAVVCAVGVGTAMIAFLLWFGCRRLPTGMPVVGSCSAAIAAACHPPLSEQESMMWEKPLQWGETPAAIDGSSGHCSFSSGVVTYPLAGTRYFY